MLVAWSTRYQDVDSLIR